MKLYVLLNLKDEDEKREQTFLFLPKTVDLLYCTTYIVRFGA